MRTSHHRPIRWVVAFVLALLVTVPSSAAWAYRAGDYTATGVNIRTGAGTGYTSLGLGYPGQGICLWYTQSGWGNHTNRATGVRGWSSNAYLAIYVPTVYCA